MLEQYLRVYCDYHQDNWYELLPLAEFIYNNAQNSSTRMSPFFANYGCHPRYKVTVSAPLESSNPAAETFVDQIQAIHTELKEHLQNAQERYKENHDRYTQQAPEFQVGDKVWLMRRNIRTTWPSQKLDVKWMEPFKILEMVEDGKMVY